MFEERRDQMAIHSSIALLQERFRQLQRVKEMRKEKELIKMLSESDKQYSCFMLYDLSKLFFPSELILEPQKPLSSQVSLSLWPHSQMNKYANFKGFETPRHFTTQSWINDTTLLNQKFDDLAAADSEVDTSLHL